MTCRTPLSGTATPLSGPPFPPYSVRLAALFNIGDVQHTLEFSAERDTLIEKMIADFTTALDAGTIATVSVTYCNTTLLKDVDLLTFDITSFHHALFRVAVAENKTIKFVITLSQAQVAATTVQLNLVGVQGNGCCRGPQSCLAAPVAGACCGQMTSSGELVGEEYPPYTTTLQVVTDAAGNAQIDYEAERDTLFLDLLVTKAAGAAFSDASIRAEYCNTVYLEHPGVNIFFPATFNHGMMVVGVAENKKLRLNIANGGNAQRWLITLTGVQGAGCCR